MNISLIGYRGTGKSTVAQCVARRLAWNWVDADAYLEAQAGATIRELFEREGESAFRAREVLVIAELCRRDRLVIAAGGGAVLREENRQTLRSAGVTIWLVASPDVIEQRVAADAATASRRPPLTRLGEREEIRRLLADRDPLYRECADTIIDTDSRTPDEIAHMIVQFVQSWTRE